jgi:hypothetical protein
MSDSVCISGIDTRTACLRAPRAEIERQHVLEHDPPVVGPFQMKAKFVAHP